MNNDLIFILKCIKINRPIGRELCNFYVNCYHTDKSCGDIGCHTCLFTASALPQIYVNSIIRIKIEDYHES